MKRPFPVIACNKHFAICAYRLTGCLADKEFIYTIVDWANDRRGPDNIVFGPAHNYLNPEEAEEALKQLGNGRMKRVLWTKPGPHFGKYVWQDNELETSRRRSTELDLEHIIRA